MRPASEPASSRVARDPGRSHGVRPLSVLQITHQGQGSGSTRSIADLSLHLARRGHRVLVGCRPGTSLAEIARGAGLEVVPLDFRRLSTLNATLAGLVPRLAIDVVNSHATRDRRALAWLRWRRRLEPAFVVTRRTMPRTAAPEVMAVGLAADRTIAISAAVANALRRRGQPVTTLRIVPNGLDLARVDVDPDPRDLAAARAALGEPGGRRVVVVVARRKDQPVLMRALRPVARPVLLGLVGIEADDDLRALARTLPERHRVVFVPFTESALAFYRLAAVAALPSRIEGLSQSLLEAMALGLPVLASRAGGNPELVRHGRTGLLVPPLDEEAWSEALAGLLEDPEFAADLGREARSLVRRAFTIERTVERTEAVYCEAIEAGRRRRRQSRQGAMESSGTSSTG